LGGNFDAVGCGQKSGWEGLESLTGWNLCAFAYGDDKVASPCGGVGVGGGDGGGREGGREDEGWIVERWHDILAASRS